MLQLENNASIQQNEVTQKLKVVAMIEWDILSFYSSDYTWVIVELLLNVYIPPNFEREKSSLIFSSTVLDIFHHFMPGNEKYLYFMKTVWSKRAIDQRFVNTA